MAGALWGDRYSLQRPLVEGGGRPHLDEALAEKHLDDLLDNGQQAGVVHANATLQHRQCMTDLRQTAVIRRQDVHGAPENALHQRRFVAAVELQACQLSGQIFALALAQRKHDDLQTCTGVRQPPVQEGAAHRWATQAGAHIGVAGGAQGRGCDRQGH